MKEYSLKLSIIIPTLNEENYIQQCISTVIKNSEILPEIIVVDAGSTDGTIKLLRSFADISVVSDKLLRGYKYASLNKGAEMSTGNILLFLDADTVLPKRYDRLILNAINSGFKAGAFHLKFNNSNALLMFIAFMNSMRYILTKRFFGDQAIFCTKEVFKAVNGFPETRILEAAHFCQNLKSKTKLILLQAAVITSSRRFEQEGVLKTFLFDLKILAKDILNMNLKRDGENYWNKINR